MDWFSEFSPKPVFRRVGDSSLPLNGLDPVEGPYKIVLDTAQWESVSAASEVWAATGRVPHFTVGPAGAVQHLAMDRACTMMPGALPPTVYGPAVWMVVLPGVDLDYLGELLVYLASELRVAPHLRLSKIGRGQWEVFGGITTVDWVPGSVHKASLDTEWLAEALAVALDAEEEPEEEPEPLEVEVVSALGDFPGRPVKLGSQGKAVNMLRASLGLEPGNFDEELDFIVRAFQEEAELEETGVVDSETWDAIDRLIAGDEIVEDPEEEELPDEGEPA